MSMIQFGSELKSHARDYGDKSTGYCIYEGFRYIDLISLYAFLI